jgi:hypothetical protein
VENFVNKVEKRLRQMQSRLCLFFGCGADGVDEPRRPLLFAAAGTRAVPVVHEVSIHIHLIGQWGNLPASGTEDDIASVGACTLFAGGH